MKKFARIYIWICCGALGLYFLYCFIIAAYMFIASVCGYDIDPQYKYNRFDEMLIEAQVADSSIIDMAEIMPFEWDSLYYFPKSCLAEQRELMLSMDVNSAGFDLIVFTKEGKKFFSGKRKKAFYDRWEKDFPQGYYMRWTNFLPRDSFFCVSRDDARFRITRAKSDEDNLFDLEHIPNENN